MGDGPVDQGSNDARSKAAELRRSAAARGSDLTSRGSELGRSAADTARIAATRGADTARSAATRGADIGRNMRRLDVPWARCGFARTLREAILGFGLGPLMDLYTRAKVFGREQFTELPAPVVFVANHSSHLDTPTILRALPRKWRQRTAVAAASDYFYKKRTVANGVALIFNTVPIARAAGAGGGSTEQVDRLIDQRWNVLLFPEGTRSRDGRLGKMRSGAAVLAQQHGVPIVPILVKGTHDAMPPGRNWPRRIKGRFFSRRHKIEVHFGEPITPAEGEHRREVMERVRAFLAEGGDSAGPNGRTRFNGPKPPEQHPLTPAA
jgi:1-acyl-sn-glycerol-3-phosphate acyltransferase